MRLLHAFCCAAACKSPKLGVVLLRCCCRHCCRKGTKIHQQQTRAAAAVLHPPMSNASSCTQFVCQRDQPRARVPPKNRQQRWPSAATETPHPSLDLDFSQPARSDDLHRVPNTERSCTTKRAIATAAATTASAIITAKCCKKKIRDNPLQRNVLSMLMPLLLWVDLCLSVAVTESAAETYANLLR